VTRSDVYRRTDDSIHTPNDDPTWQESHLLVWYDLKAGIGGFHRLGHEPNTGRASSLIGIVTRHGVRYRSMQDDVQLAQAHRNGGVHAAGDHHRVLTDPDLRLEVDEADLQLSLVITDHHPLFKWFSATDPEGGGRSDESGSDRKLATDHYEVGGRVEGSIVLDGQKHKIDGWIIRDHSWGPRDWHLILAHRWVFANFGPELVIPYIDLVLDGGRRLRRGMVIRHGVAEPIVDGDIVLLMESDAFSYRGASVRVTAADGFACEFTARAVDSIATESHGMVFSEALCTAEYQGVEGFVLVEASNNARAGTAPVQLALRAATIDGLSTRELTDVE
jgi:hypothetical protein